MRLTPCIRLARSATFVAAIVLSACGGGSPQAAAPAPAPTVAPILQRDVQRAALQNALVDVEATVSVNAFLNGGYLFTFGARRSVRDLQTGLPTDGTCVNSQTLRTETVGITQTQDYILYRDPQCHVRRYEQYFAQSTLDAARRDDTFVITDYDDVGAVREISRDLITYVQYAFSDQTIIFQGAKAYSASAKPFATLWASFKLRGSDLAGQIIQTGLLASGKAQGTVAALTGNASRGASRVATGSYAIVTQTFIAEPNTFSIIDLQSTPPWSLRGGIRFSTATWSGTVAAPGGIELASTPIADAGNDASVAVTMQGGITRGTLTQTSTSKALATFSIDASGSGALQYSDGTAITITGWSLPQ